MSAFSFDPQKLLGNLSSGLTGLPIIIGLPSPQDPVPHFAIGVTTEERSAMSNSNPGFQLTAGDLFLKSSRNPGEFSFKMIFSETPNVKNEQIEAVTQMIQQISNLSRALFLAFSGSVSPNLSGISSNFAVAQLTSLKLIKDGFQPILALNLYMPLSTFSSSNPYLSSAWYIDRIDTDKRESERGFVSEISLKEVLTKRNGVLGFNSSIVTNLANEVVGPGVGSSILSVLP